MMLTCTLPTGDDVCGKPTDAATALCRHHLRRLHTDLEVIARLWPAFHAQRQAWLTWRKPAQPGKAKTLGSPSPGNIAVMSATDPSGSVFSAIHGWARDLLHTDRQLDPGEAARALSMRADLIACHPALEEIVPELHRAAVALAEILDEHFNTEADDAKPRRVKTCRESDPRDPERDCGGAVTWRPGTLAIVCQRCGHEHEVGGYASIGKVAAAFGIDPSTIHRWVKRGLVDKIAREVCVDQVRQLIRTRRAESL